MALFLKEKFLNLDFSHTEQKGAVQRKSIWIFSSHWENQAVISPSDIYSIHEAPVVTHTSGWEIMAVFNVFSTLYSYTSQHFSYSTLEDTKTSTDSKAKRQKAAYKLRGEKCKKGLRHSMTHYIRSQFKNNILKQILIVILPQPC